MVDYQKYKSPNELIHDDNLSREEKIKLLQRWRDDKKDLLRASGEGMEGPDRADWLKKIKKALNSLQAAAPK